MFSPGLGEELDITAPVLDVDQANESYVSGDITLTGNYEDDGTISSISVLINSAQTSLNAEIDVQNNSWKVLVPTEKYSDGSYEVTVVITDASGKSTKQSLVLYFDNHAPVVLVKEPLSFNGTLNGDIAIKGEVADKFRIASVEVLLFDGNGNELPWNEGGVSLEEENRKLLEDMTNSWSFDFDSESYTETTGTYGFEIIATDLAGNSSSYFYDYSDLLDSNSDNSFSVDELELLEREGVIGDGMQLTRSILEVSRMNRISLYVDQNVDLPYYEFDTPSEDSMVLTDSLQAFGRVLDDDGVNVSSIEISLDQGSWTGVTQVPDANSMVASWSHNLSMLGEGHYTLQIRSEDIYGTPSVSEELMFVIDSAGPSIQIDSPESGVYKNSGFTVSGVTSDRVGVQRVDMSVDGGSYTTVATFGVPESESEVHSWTANVPQLTDGSHTLRFRSVDFSEKFNTDSLLVNIDSADPVVIYLSPQNNATVNGMIQVHGTTSNQSSISEMILTVSDGTVSNSYTLNDSINEFDTNADLDTVLTGGAPGAASTRYFWYKNIDTTEYTDNHALSISLNVRDEAGNEMTGPVTVLLNQDTDLPVMYFDNLSTGSGVTAMDNSFSGSPSLIGRIQDDDGVDLSSIEVEVDESGSWTAPTVSGSGLSVNWDFPISSLSQGAHSFRIRAADIYSSTLKTSSLIPFIYDTGVPTMSISEILWGENSLSSGFQGAYINSDATIRGNASDGIAVASVAVNINGQTENGEDVYDTIFTAGSVLLDSVDWEYDLDLAACSEGNIDLKFRTVDYTGKVSYSDLSLIKDTSAPEIEFTDLYGSTQRSAGLNGLIQIKGTASDENQVERVEYALLKDTGSVTVSDVSSWSLLDRTYSWSFWFDSTVLDDGDYVVYVRARDSSGNNSSDAEIEAKRYEFTLDQGTDLPAFQFTNLDAGGAAENLIGLNKTTLTGKVTDDDGLSLASIMIHFDNGTLQWNDSVTVDETSNGLTEYTWHYDLPSDAVLPQSADPYEIILSASDTGETGGEFTKGAVSADSEIISVYLDRTAPVLTGRGTSELQIISSEISISGQASDENELTALKLSIDGQEAVDVPVDSEGDWSYAFNKISDGLSDGQYALVFTASDAAGRSTSITRNIYIDATAPTIVLTSLLPSYVDESLSVSGTAQDPGEKASGVRTIEYSLDTVAGENESAQWYALNGTTAWSGNISTAGMAEDSMTIRFRALDGGGRYSDQIIRTILIDHNAPRAEMNISGTLAVFGGEDYTREAFALQGVADDDAFDRADASVRAAAASVLSYTRNGGSKVSVNLVPGTDGSWSWSSPAVIEDDPATTEVDESESGLQDGLYEFTLTVSDEVGRISTAQTVLNVDTTAPVLVVSSPVDDEAVEEATFTISGTARDTGGVGFDLDRDVEYSQDNLSWTSLNLSGISWSREGLSLTGSEGAKTLYVRSTDALGNRSTAEVSFYYDVAPPALTEAGYSATSTTYVDNDFSFAGTWTESNSLKEIRISYTKDGSDTVLEAYQDGSNTSGEDIPWSYDIDVDPDNSGDTAMGIQDGLYEFTITAVDQANRTKSLRRIISVDTTAPVVTAPESISGYFDESVTISGTAEDPGTGSGASGVEKVLYSLDSGTSWQQISGTTAWSGSPDISTLAEGSLEVLFKAVDRAGKESLTDSTLINIDHMTPRAVMNATGTFVSSGGENYSREDFTLSGTADDDAFNRSDAAVRAASSVELSYTRNGGSKVTEILSPADGVWSRTFQPAPEDDPATTGIDESEQGLSDGLYVFTLTVTDEAGKSSTDQQVLVIDTTAPTLTVSAPLEREAVDSISYPLSGTVRDTGGIGFDGAEDVEYRLDNGVWKALNLDGIEWSDTLDLGSESEGAKTLHVRSTDAVGNQTLSDITFYYDLNAPALTESGIASTDTFYLNDDFTLSGTWTESNELTSIVIEYEDEEGNTAELESLTPADFGGSDSGDGVGWSSLIPINSDNHTDVLEDGSYSFTLTITDGADRTSVVTRNIMIDRELPSLDTYTTAGSEWLSAANISFSGTASDNDGSGVDSVEYLLVDEGFYQIIDGAYVIDNGADDDENWSLFTSSTSEGITSFNATIRLNNGTSLLLLRSTDKAGNLFLQEETDWQTILVDTLVPAVSISSPASGQQINADSDLVVTADYSDDDSGVERIELSLDNFATVEDTAVEGGTDSEGQTIAFITPAGSQNLVLSQETLADGAMNDGSHTLYVRAVDSAGNSSAVSTLSIIRDTELPEGVFTSHADASVINKTISFSGTAEDNRSLNPIGKLEIENSSGTWEDISSDVTISGTYNWSVTGFDSTAYDTAAYDSNASADGIQYNLRLELTDTAGNTGYASISLNPDQDADRPEIKLNNLTLGEMSSVNYIWLKQANVIYGTVSDDDGVNKLEVSSDSGSNWTVIPVSSGAWTYQIAEDGAYTMLFRVTDAAGTLFTASEAPSYSLESPKLTDNEATPNTYGYSDSASGATALYITVDTQNPDVTSVQYLEAVDQWSTAVSSKTFGGTVDSIQLRQFSYDANDIESVEMSLEEKVDDEAGAVYTYAAAAGTATETINGNLYNAYAADIDISTLASGSRSLSITVKDRAGLTTKSTVSLIIDNTAPTLNLDSHDNNDQVSGTVNLKGSTGGSAQEVLYKVTSSSDVPSDEPNFWTVPVDSGSGDPDYTVYGAHKVLSALSSWRVNFDDDINNYDGFTHDRTLKRYIVALNSSLELNESGSVVYVSDGSKYTDITTLYIHFRTTDAYGNSDESIYYTLKVDPQGDIPIVSMTYPSASSYGWYNSGAGMVYTAGESPLPGDDVYSDISMNTLLGSLSSVNSTDRTVSYNGIVYSSRGGNVIQGGILRIQGTAEDDKSITGIYLQIDPGYDPADGFQWDNSSAASAGAELLPDNRALSDVFSGEIVKFFGDPVTAGPADQYGIEVGDSISWSYTLNEDGEFNGTDGENNQIALRIYAIDIDGNISSLDTSEDCIVTIDSAAPRIGSSEPLYLYQYSNNAAGTGDIVASKEYSDGMWLKGQWWLVGSVEDESGISSISMSGSSDFQTTAVANDGTWTGTYGYRIKALIGSDADTFGTLSYVLSAVDNDDGNKRRIDKDISLNFDNKAPELLADTDGNFDIDERVVQSNGFYTLGSRVFENSSSTASQSGFARVAFYFLRRGTDTRAVYDTWYLKDDLSNKLAYESLQYDSGLYWMTETGIGREENLKVLTLNSTNPNIHPGGLVKIGGAIYTITSVSGATVIIDGSPAIGEDTAYFAVAQVVDHELTESNGTVMGANGYYTNVINDDSDSMVESVSVQGGTAIWEANINSRNIPDGPIEIHYVAFDEAGNYSIGIVGSVVQGSYTGDDASEVDVYSYKSNTRVANNAPRLAAVWYGSDDDGSGTVETDELTGDLFGVDHSDMFDSADAGIEYDSSRLTDSYAMGAVGDSLMAIKGNVAIIPEIVGGNGNLYYGYNVTRSGETVPYYAVDVDTDTPWAAGTDYSGSGANEEILDTAAIELTLEDFLSPGDTGSEIVDAANQTFSFTFWDSTDESEVGVNSQSASLSMVMDVALRDVTPPQVSIDPFFWNNESDSSTAGLEGHIELAGSNGRATPAVSGTVKMTGTVHDNKLVENIYLNIPGWNGGTTVLAASYDSSSFTSASLPAGVVFSAETVSLDNSGHDVSWSMEWDTSTIADTAVNGLDVTVSAADRGKPVYSGTLSYEPNSGSTAETMDVVPYIVKVETALSKLKSNNWSVYNRTALGHYPVKTDEIIYVYGYNLTGADGVTVEKDGVFDKATINVAGITQSGALSLTVNGVSTLNNSNSNDAEYNKQPNGDNNELLTDDVYLDIWEMDSQAAAPISGMIEQPVMKINPVEGMIGFAFVNGPLYFSMGDSNYSAQYWMGSYDFFTSTGFAYDKLGYSYGVAAGGDINSGSADKFQFMTSRWGLSNRSQSGSYDNDNSLRLESIGQVNSGIINFNKQRIKSPSLATSVHGDRTYVYLAYYDDINEEIRFKAGSTRSTNNRTNFGSFVDSETAGYPSGYYTDYVSMIAGSNTGNIAGEYVSIAVVSDENNTFDDVVAAVWYDPVNRCLWYSYNDSPADDRDGDTTGTGWSEPIRVFDAGSDMANAGEYAQIIADKSGGLHIAAYDPVNLDLVYAHFNAYDDPAAETSVVDGYGVVGSNITLDVALSGGQWIPYIGYYATSTIKPKYAYKVDTTSDAPAGSVDEAYTGKWEITVLPTDSVLTMGSLGNNKINIGVWKDAGTWALEASTTGTKLSEHWGASYTATSRDTVYGNGTVNPVLGYAIRSGSNGYVETAQKK